MRFGLVGAGCIGQIRAQALHHAELCELSAVFDVRPEAARALASSNGTPVCKDYASLLARDDVDAVIISTPPLFHEEQVLAALDAGKHVLCEKPLSNSVEACRRMVEAAQTTGRVLATGFNHRYFPAIQFVKQTLDRGLIGDLDHIRAFAGHIGLSEFRAPWEHDKKVIGGGALMDVGIHLIDLTRYLLGEVEEVYGVATGNIWKLKGSEDNGLALLRSPEGKYATLQATWAEWKGYRFHIEAYGDRGMVRAYYAPMMNVRIIMDQPGGRPRRERHFYPHIMLREKLRGWQSTADRTFRQELADFIRLCDGQPSAIADGFAGFRAVEIAHAVYRCTEERTPVRLTARF